MVEQVKEKVIIIVFFSEYTTKALSRTPSNRFLLYIYARFIGYTLRNVFLKEGGLFIVAHIPNKYSNQTFNVKTTSGFTRGWNRRYHNGESEDCVLFIFAVHVLKRVVCHPFLTCGTVTQSKHPFSARSSVQNDCLMENTYKLLCFVLIVLHFMVVYLFCVYLTHSHNLFDCGRFNNIDRSRRAKF